MPECGTTTHTIFIILRQLQKKYLAADLEKAFDQVHRDAVWWALRKFDVEEWLVKIVQSMYRNAQSRFRVNGTFSDDFLVQTGLHEGSV